MSDEFEYCKSCGAFDPRTIIKFSLEFKKGDLESIEEILEIPISRDMCLDEDQLNLIDENNILYDNLVEFQICQECDNEFEGGFAGRN